MISRQSIGRVFFRSILVASFTQPFVFTEAVTFSFFKVADTDTVVPGSSATFEGFLGAEPVISGNNIAFLGQDNVNFNDGIYLFDGNILSVVADFSTPIPDRSGVNFTDFDEDLSISGSTVAFEGFVDNAGFTAFDNLVVPASGGNLTILAAETTTFVPPGNTSLFVDVDEPMIRGTTAVFVGNEDESDAGIFFSSGSAVSFIANLNAPVPGRPTYSFSQFDNNISFDGTRIIPSHKEKIGVPRRFQWDIAEGMLSLPTAKWSMVISFFSGVMASGFAFGCAKDTVEFFNAGIGEVRFPVGEGFLLVIFDYVGPWV